jgi:tetratricopeptide (TPR) repeat protein
MERMQGIMKLAFVIAVGALACGPGSGVPADTQGDGGAVTQPGAVPMATEASDTVLLRANRLLDTGEWQLALEVYQQLPPSAAVLKGMGIAHMRLWELQPALRALQQARTLAPRDAEIAGYLAEALTLNRDLDEAILVYREAIGLAGTDVNLRASYAVALAWSGNHSQAIAEYRTALELQPDHVRSRLGLAETLGWTRDFAGALAEYRRALELTTNLRERSRAHAGAAQVLAWQGELPQALAEYGRALEANPRNTDALYGMAEVHEWRREYSAAKRLYEQILQFDPDHSGAKQKLLQLGWVR